jgi:hypothetical protein
MAIDDIFELYCVALFLIITPTISRTGENTTSEIQEWIDAAGETHWHLATIVVRYLDFIAAHPLHSELHVHAALAFICQFLGDENRDLLDTLLEWGLAGALTGTAGALSEHMDYPIDNHLDRSFRLLMFIPATVRYGSYREHDFWILAVHHIFVSIFRVICFSLCQNVAACAGRFSCR